jgi:hypothetical protein
LNDKDTTESLNVDQALQWSESWCFSKYLRKDTCITDPCILRCCAPLTEQNDHSSRNWNVTCLGNLLKVIAYNTPPQVLDLKPRRDSTCWTFFRSLFVNMKRSFEYGIKMFLNTGLLRFCTSKELLAFELKEINHRTENINTRKSVNIFSRT